jgi:hypothetical protein
MRDDVAKAISMLSAGQQKDLRKYGQKRLEELVSYLRPVELVEFLGPNKGLCRFAAAIRQRSNLTGKLTAEMAENALKRATMR